MRFNGSKLLFPQNSYRAVLSGTLTQGPYWHRDLYCVSGGPNSALRPELWYGATFGNLFDTRVCGAVRTRGVEFRMQKTTNGHEA